MDGTRRKPISNEVVAAYSHCSRKAFLLHCTEERGTPHEYLEMLEECTNVSRSRYWALLRETSAPIRSYRWCPKRTHPQALVRRLRTRTGSGDKLPPWDIL